MAKIYPLNKISYQLCYTIEDICILYKDYKLHEQTVRKWIKKGLSIIDNQKPNLIYGFELKKFLGKLNEDRKVHTEFDEFYCFSCKESHRAYQNQISVVQNSSSIKVQAICPKTKKSMYKNFKLADYGRLKKIYNTVDVLRLCDSDKSTLKTKISNNSKIVSNASLNQEEFSYE